MIDFFELIIFLTQFQFASNTNQNTRCNNGNGRICLMKTYY